MRKHRKWINAAADLIRKQVQVKKYNSKHRIYVAHFSMWAAHEYIGDDIVAKRIQDEKKLDVTAVQMGECSELCKIDEAFGFEVNNFLDKSCNMIRVWLAALFVMLFRKKDIIGLKYRGISIGNVLYDELIDQYIAKKNEFTCKCWDWEIGFPLLIKSFRSIENMRKEFKKFPPEYLVILEINHYRGIMAVVAEHYGADVVLSLFEQGSLLPVMEACRNRSYNLQGMYMYHLIINKSKEKGYSYWTNKYNDNMFLYPELHNNKGRERCHILQSMGITNQKKNVVILPHCIADSPRETIISMPFKDYDEWLVETLAYIQNIKEVNWIIKDHPVSKQYAQEKYIKELYATYKTDNLYWMDNKEYSGNDVKCIADCVVTCAGDAGCEYVIYGIPTITCAKTAYSVMGISNNAASKHEYFQLLQNIDNLSAVSEKEKNKAKYYITVMKNISLEYSTVYTQLNWKTRVKWIGYNEKAKAANRDEVNREFLLEFCEFLKQVDLNDLEWYFTNDLKRNH